MEGGDGKKEVRVNAEKTKVMWCQVSKGKVEDSGKHPYGVCRKGVGNNSILSVECVRWVHKICSGFSGRLKRTVDFHCRHSCSARAKRTLFLAKSART